MVGSCECGDRAIGLRERRSPGYETDRPDVQALVPLTASRILEVGCSAGALGAALKARNGAYVVGVEIDPVYAKEAAQRLDEVVVADAEAFVCQPRPDRGSFDCLIGADVFEHLVDPWLALRHATEMLSPGATVVVSLPNVLHWVAMWKLIVHGRWPREDVGVFDRTHLRWFTMRDSIELVESAGLQLQQVTPNYPGRGVTLAVTRFLGRTPLRRFLAIQWLIVARKNEPSSDPSWRAQL